MNITKIQWCDSTVNPIMGCKGCELFPHPNKVLSSLAEAMTEAGVSTTADELKNTFKERIDELLESSENAHPSHSEKVTTTNIWHLKKWFIKVVKKKHGKAVAKAAEDGIKTSLTCYAGIIHLNRGANITDREGRDKTRILNSGYSPVFEELTRFEGRVKDAAKWKDLLGTSNEKTPWKDKLPRMIFVSDMGDALTRIRF